MKTLLVLSVFVASANPDMGIWQFAFGLMGGAAAGAMITFIGNQNLARSARKSERTRQQLELLYGPLHFYCSQNQTLLDHNREISEAIRKVFTGYYGVDRKGNEQYTERIVDAIKIANEFIDTITVNNRKIVDLLVANFWLVDVEDTEPFQQFALMVRRWEVEFKDNKLALDPSVYLTLKPINFNEPDFAARIFKRFTEKMRQLQRLENIDLES